MLRQTEGSTEAQEVQNQWGFLKNIVNIDTFFSSGALSESKPSKKEEAIEKPEK